jgi:hypothetical protein
MVGGLGLAHDEVRANKALVPMPGKIWTPGKNEPEKTFDFKKRAFSGLSNRPNYPSGKKKKRN